MISVTSKLGRLLNPKQGVLIKDSKLGEWNADYLTYNYVKHVVAIHLVTQYVVWIPDFRASMKNDFELIFRGRFKEQLFVNGFVLDPQLEELVNDLNNYRLVQRNSKSGNALLRNRKEALEYWLSDFGPDGLCYTEEQIIQMLGDHIVVVEDKDGTKEYLKTREAMMRFLSERAS